MDLYPVNTYFDFEDFEDPIKFFIEDAYFYPIMPGWCKHGFIYLRRSFTNLQDSFLPIFPSKNHTFFSIQRSRDVIMDPTY